MTAIGKRVIAVRDMNQDEVNIFGVGTYVGDEIPPWRTEETVPDEDAAMIREILDQEDKRETPASVDLIEWIFEKEGNPAEMDGKTKEEWIAGVRMKQEAERLRPIEERIKELYLDSMTNPCIHLDNGDTVWGMQCWWGEEEAVKAKYKGRPVKVVPVPEQNVPWKEKV